MAFQDSLVPPGSRAIQSGIQGRMQNLQQRSPLLRNSPLLNKSPLLGHIANRFGLGNSNQEKVQKGIGPSKPAEMMQQATPNVPIDPGMMMEQPAPPMAGPPEMAQSFDQPQMPVGQMMGGLGPQNPALQNMMVQQQKKPPMMPGKPTY